MARIDQVILPVDVIDIDIIVVIIPVGRPRLGVLEIIPAVIKAAIIAAVHAEMMFTPEAGAKLHLRNAPGGTAVVVLFGLLGTLLVLRTILLLCGSGLVIAIAVVLLLDAIALLLSSRTIFLLRGLGAILILLLPGGFLLGLLCGPLLILFAFIWFFALLGLFLFFGLFLGPISIGLLPRVAGGANKEHHHRCTKDELHFNSSVFCFTNDRAYVVGNTSKSGLAGMGLFNTEIAKARYGKTLRNAQAQRYTVTIGVQLLFALLGVEFSA